MDGPPLAGNSDDGLSWFYLDSVQKEFGPFANHIMREWFMQGFFPLGEELLIRLPHWKHHVPLKMVYPDVADAFLGMPRSSPPGPPPSQVDSYSGGFDNSLPPYPPADGFMGGRRQLDEPLHSFSPPTSQGQMGGYCMMPSGGSFSPGPGSPGLGNGSSLPGLPGSIQGGMGGLSGGMPSGVQGGIPGMDLPHGDGLAMPRRSNESSFASGFPGGCQGMLPQQRAMGMQPSMHSLQSGGAASGRFRGRIKSFNAKQGFGFIENPEAYAIFGRDVFLHKAQIGNLKVGTEVTYGVEMNKQGMPQARDLTTLDGMSPGPTPPSTGKGAGKTKTSGVGRGRGRGSKDDGDGGGKDAKKGRGKGNQPKASGAIPGLLPSSTAPALSAGFPPGSIPEGGASSVGNATANASSGCPL